MALGPLINNYLSVRQMFLGLNLAVFIASAIGICFYFNNKSFYFIFAGSILFMTGYISLATIIPSVANDIAENSYRGAANGIINSFQYIGSFVGAVITGALWNNHKNMSLFLIIVISIMYSYHKYKLPVKVLDEAYKFYYDEWKKNQELKDFKLNLIEIVLKEGMEEGILK